MQPLSITPRVERNVAIFDLSGEIDISNVDRVKETIHPWIQNGYRNVILNLSQVRYMDSSGLSLMISLKKKLDSQGSVSLVGCPPIIRRMMTLTRLNTLIPTYDSEEDALRTMAAGGTEAMLCS